MIEHTSWFAHDNYVVTDRMIKDWPQIVAYCDSEDTAKLVQFTPDLFSICKKLQSIFEDFCAGEGQNGVEDFGQIMAEINVIMANTEDL